MSKVAEAIKHYQLVVLPSELVPIAEKSLERAGYVLEKKHIPSERFGFLELMGIEPLDKRFDNVDVLGKFTKGNEEVIAYLW